MRAAVSGQNGPGSDRMIDDDGEDTEYVASATECTGVAPALREGDDAARALYAVHPAKRRNRKKPKA